MGTLYVDHRGAALRVSSGAAPAVVIEVEGERPRSIPLSLLERLVVQGEASLTSTLLGRLAEAGIGMVTLSGRQSWRTACLLGRPHKDVRIRLAQYQLALDPPRRAAWARRWVGGKLRGQARLLRQARARRAEAGMTLQTALERIEALRGKLGEAGLESLRGLEGAAAAVYFPAFARLFAPALGFAGRNRRPPRDPVNAALSLGYTLLQFEAVRAAQAAGLDPLLGSLHEPAYGRESLACDLVEPLRPRLDGWVWELFRERRLRIEQFTYDKGACVLHKAGRRAFYEGWEEAAARFRRPLAGYCRLLVRELRQTPLPLSPAAPDWSEFPLEAEAGAGEESEGAKHDPAAFDHV